MKWYLKLMTLGLLTFIISCDEDDDPAVSGVLSVQVNNLPADPPTGYDPNTGAPIGTTNKYSFFRFSDSTIVAGIDSATTKWDIGFRAQDIIVNSGSSGPGSAAAFTFTGLFNELDSVPADSIFKQDQLGSLAIGRTWYNYDPVAMVLIPKPGRVIVIRTADNKYVKMEILSYYKDSPASPKFTDPARYYSFRYVYQKDGTTSFK
ncbi:MAG: HmuY family protein [Saprospiraceae bacterium]|nr:HmuY family protein [Saprospiraceae bacterium]